MSTFTTLLFLYILLTDKDKKLASHKIFFVLFHKPVVLQSSLLRRFEFAYIRKSYQCPKFSVNGYQIFSQRINGNHKEMKIKQISMQTKLFSYT